MGQVSGVSSEQLRETYTRLRPFIMLLKDASLKKKTLRWNTVLHANH